MSIPVVVAMLASSLASPDETVSLKISSAQRAVLVGEPVKLVVTASEAQGVRGVSADELQFRVTCGAKARLYIENPMVLRAGTVSSRENKRPPVANVVLAVGTYQTERGDVPSLLFPERGRCDVQAVWVKAGAQRCASNTLTFNVEEPAGDDISVLEFIREHPAALKAMGDAEVQAKTRLLVQSHRPSRYVRWARVRLMESAATSLVNGLDPETGERLDVATGTDAASAVQRRYVTLANALADSEDWAPFEEEALALAHRYGSLGGAEGIARQARERLLKEFPASLAAWRIKRDEAALTDVESRAPAVSPPPPHR